MGDGGGFCTNDETIDSYSAQAQQGRVVDGEDDVTHTEASVQRCYAPVLDSHNFHALRGPIVVAFPEGYAQRDLLRLRQSCLRRFYALALPAISRLLSLTQ